MSKPSCLCGECAVCKHRVRNRRYYGYQGKRPPDRRRRWAVRLADIPLELRLAGVRTATGLEEGESAELLSAALWPDPDFTAWVAEPLNVEKLAQRLYNREAKRSRRAVRVATA